MKNRIEDIYNNIIIDQYKTDIGFKTLVEGVNDYLYVIPEYQRKFKWTWTQVEGLAESLFRGLPIPPIYVCRNTKTGDLEILDGQQRVISLFLYYKGKYFKNRKERCFDYRLIETEKYDDFESALMKTVELEDRKFMTEYNNEKYDISYNSLPPKIRKKIDYTTISIIEIKVSSENKWEEVIPRIFANLNSGGTNLEPQEIRNGIYAGEFYSMLKNINVNNVKWRKLYGKNIDDNENDMKCLVKLCAYKYYSKFEQGKFQIENYSGKLENFLDEFSALTLTFDKKQIEIYKTSIEHFIELFDFDRKIDSLPVFEGIFVVFDKLEIDRKITWNSYKEMKEAVLDTLDQGTAQRAKMLRRWEGIYEFLSKND